jgi:hypothetical protein
MPQDSTSILPQNTEPSYLHLTLTPAIVSYLQTVHHHTILPPLCHTPTRENLNPAPRHHDIVPPHCHTPHHHLTSTPPRDTKPPSTSTLFHTTITSCLRPAMHHSTFLPRPCHTPPHPPTSTLPHATTPSYILSSYLRSATHHHTCTLTLAKHYNTLLPASTVPHTQPHPPTSILPNTITLAYLAHATQPNPPTLTMPNTTTPAHLDSVTHNYTLLKMEPSRPSLHEASKAQVQTRTFCFMRERVQKSLTLALKWYYLWQPFPTFPNYNLLVSNLR